MGPALALSMVATVSERVMTEKVVGKVSDSSAPLHSGVVMATLPAVSFPEPEAY